MGDSALKRSDLRRIAFVSSNAMWGGSEELWSAAALLMAERGHGVLCCKLRVQYDEPRVKDLLARGCVLHELYPPDRLVTRARAFASRLVPLLRYDAESRLRRILLADPPSLVVLSQGINHEAAPMALVCKAIGLPYVIISQKADDIYWPRDALLDEVVAAYASARVSYFVSDHNRRLTEEQVATPIRNAIVVRNPFQVPWAARTDWPDHSAGLRLACVGRLDTREKGQDLLLRVMAQDKWRVRPVTIGMFGAGLNDRGLRSMAEHLNLPNVRFEGFTRNPASIWDDHHALVLPSRCEGLPLALVEAMLSARVAIVTAVGGNAELLDDGATGFIAAAATERHLDEAMERAWSARADWRAIGRRASAAARAAVPEDPVSVFVEHLLQVA